MATARTEPEDDRMYAKSEKTEVYAKSEKTEKDVDAMASYSSGKNKLLQIYKLEVRCEAFFQSSEFSIALYFLNELSSHRPDHLKTMIMVAECKHYLNDDDEAFWSIEDVKAAMSKEPKPGVEDLLTESSYCLKLGMYFRALLFVWCACAVYNDQPTSRYSMEGIEKCIQTADNIYWRVMEEYLETGSKIKSQKLTSMQLRQLTALKSLKMFENPHNCELAELVNVTRIGSIARCYVCSLRFSEAIPYYLKCVDFLKTLGGKTPGSCDMAEHLTSIAQCYIELGGGNRKQIVHWVSEARKAWETSKPSTQQDEELREEMIRYLNEALIKALPPVNVPPENESLLVGREESFVGKTKKKFVRFFHRFSKSEKTGNDVIKASESGKTGSSDAIKASESIEMDTFAS